MHEELVEVRQGADPPEPEEAGRRTGPDALDQPTEILVPDQRNPAPFGEASERARQHEARAGEQIAFSHHHVSDEIVRGPTLDQRRRRRAELVEEVAELASLLVV